MWLRVRVHVNGSEVSDNLLAVWFMTSPGYIYLQVVTARENIIKIHRNNVLIFLPPHLSCPRFFPWPRSVLPLKQNKNFHLI